MSTNTLNWKEARDILRKHREQNIRQSQLVIDLWDNVLNNSIDKFGDEKYVIWEQVCVCSLDCSRLDVAKECLGNLNSSFPNSYRVRLLEELTLESLERYDEALELLEEVLEDDPTNTAPRKRKIAILKAKGRIPDAIKELNEYLKVFMMDQEAWNELSELYLSEQEYAKAAFCIEELILHNPFHHLLYLRFADIKYTQGGYDNVELAMSYYSQALKLSPSNMRALYGLFVAAKQLSNFPKCSSARKIKAKEIIAWTLEQIQAQYDQVAETSTETEIDQKLQNLSI